MDRIIVTPGRQQYIRLCTFNSGKGRHLPDANFSLNNMHDSRGGNVREKVS